MARAAHSEVLSLTGLRFVAAMLVLLGHSLDTAFSSRSIYPAVDAVARELAFTGMSLFFVLSGCVLMLTYHAQFANQSFGRACLTFFIHRFARIGPLYFVVMLVALAVTPWDTLFGHFILPLYLLCAQAWFYITIDHGLLLMYFYPHSWSVSTEVAFYLVFPLIALGVVAAGRWTTVFAGVVVLYIASLLALHLAAQHPYLVSSTDRLTAGVDPDFVSWLSYFAPYLRLVEFAIGCLAGLLYLTAPPDRRGLFNRPLLTYVAITLLAVSAALITWSGGGSESGSAARYPSVGLFEGPIIGLIVFAVATCPTRVSRILGSSPFVFGGTISYSMYLIHPYILAEFAHPLTNVPGITWLDDFLRLLVMSASVIFFAYGTYTLIEAPCRRRIRSWAARVSSHSISENLATR